MSNNKDTDASEKHFNIPPPLQPYGLGPYNQPPPGVNHGGFAPPYGVNHQFSNNAFMSPQAPMLLSQPNFFQCPPAFSVPPPPPFPFTPPTPSHHVPPPPQVIEQGRSSISHEVPTVDKEKDVDKIWIRNWLRHIGKENKSSTNKRVVPHSIKIFEMKEKVLKVRKLIKDLEGQSKSLMVMMKSLNEEEWQIRVKEVEAKKSDLAMFLNELSKNGDQISDVRRQLDRRDKKRKRQKKKRVERKLENEERRVADEREKCRIDLWMKDMEEAVERVRREEELKREADSVLSGVTMKKNEAKRQMALLEGLGKLHRARVVAWTAMGLLVSNTQVETFNNVVDRLTDMWSNRLETYNLEEHALKVMLHEAVAEDKTSSANRQKLLLHQWENALFGSGTNAQNITHVPKDLQSFLSVRKDWDKFVVAEDSVMSSSIPVGWIIPCKPSSDDWKRLLHDQKQQ